MKNDKHCELDNPQNSFQTLIWMINQTKYLVYLKF
jgi:hypothetical protein